VVEDRNRVSGKVVMADHQGLARVELVNSHHAVEVARTTEREVVPAGVEI
jgi:hypothetical protein